MHDDQSQSAREDGVPLPGGRRQVIRTCVRPKCGDRDLSSRPDEDDDGPLPAA